MPTIEIRDYMGAIRRVDSSDPEIIQRWLLEQARDLANANRHKDDTIRHLLTSGIPILDSQGGLRGYRGMDRDITERRHMEATLREREEIYRAIITQASDAIELTEDQHRSLYPLGLPTDNCFESREHFIEMIAEVLEDMIRIQEIIWRVRPDVIVETGVAHGGSLIFYASLLTAMGKGRVIGIDVDIRAHNRQRIEAHPLAHRIDLVEGSSVAQDIVGDVPDEVGKPVELGGFHCSDECLQYAELFRVAGASEQRFGDDHVISQALSAKASLPWF